MQAERIWFTLNLALFATSVCALVGRFTHNDLFHLPLCASIALHGFLVFTPLKMLLQNTKPVTKFLLSNYSFRIAVMSFVFLITHKAPAAWIVALGVASMYQCLGYICKKTASSNNAVFALLRKLNLKLTNPPLAMIMLTMSEIFAMYPKLKTTGSSDLFMTVLVMVVYVVWILMFRYATDAFHKRVYHEYAVKIREVSAKLPSFLAKLIISFVNGVGVLGGMAESLYGQKSPNVK